MRRDGITVGGPIFCFPLPPITSHTHPFTVCLFHNLSSPRCPAATGTASAATSVSSTFATGPCVEVEGHPFLSKHVPLWPHRSAPPLVLKASSLLCRRELGEQDASHHRVELTHLRRHTCLLTNIVCHRRRRHHHFHQLHIISICVSIVKWWRSCVWEEK